MLMAKIVPHKLSNLQSPTVVTVSSDDDEDEWHETVLRFITALQNSGKITNLNQIAFLSPIRFCKEIGEIPYSYSSVYKWSYCQRIGFS